MWMHLCGDISAILPDLIEIGLNVLNPERLVARVNIDRAAASAVQLDADYLARLGADAVPLLVASLDRLDASDACDLLATLESKRPSWDESLQDWRRWNIGRTNAAHALALCALRRAG